MDLDRAEKPLKMPSNCPRNDRILLFWFEAFRYKWSYPHPIFCLTSRNEAGKSRRGFMVAHRLQPKSDLTSAPLFASCFKSTNSGAAGPLRPAFAVKQPSVSRQALESHLPLEGKSASREWILELQDPQTLPGDSLREICRGGSRFGPDFSRAFVEATSSVSSSRWNKRTTVGRRPYRSGLAEPLGKPRHGQVVRTTKSQCGFVVGRRLQPCG